MFNTAILFMIFNRPDTTEQVFDEIRKIKPARLYVAADGARNGVTGEDQKTAQVRKIITNINWDCELKTLYRDKNLGCKTAPASAIDWFFEHEEEGIILEDDCLPNQSFFYFCEQMLQRYREDERIWHISGSNYQNGLKRGDSSYYFSMYCLIWGWATWKRAWQYYDVSIASYPDFVKKNKIKQLFKSRQLQKHWLEQFRLVYENKLDAWDHQLTYAMLNHSGLSIIPNVNLISNIGFGAGATHTIDANSRFSDIKSVEIHDIIHPEFIIQDQIADDYSSKYVVIPPLLSRLRVKVGKILRQIGLIKSDDHS
ncbi:MAG: nucleotide-diphospho-sugar transferase [gamma proteobacterium symbiont of Taylorina sp.]|nr:nucleotide-diphospho-sugar transferase [gamma proteobacterium symbiont of Taylorina sp.]